MQQLKSGSIMILFLMVCCIVKSQEVIHSISLKKITQSLYRVTFTLNSSDFDAEAINLKILRRREGNVHEIFSSDISSEVSVSQKMYTYNWRPVSGIIENGDELKATISISFKPSLAKQKANSTNKIPIADAGEFLKLQLPVTKPVELNGSKSHDEDGKIISVIWKQIAGPTTLTIQNSSSLVASAAGSFKEGTYAFELTVTDDKGAKAIGRTVLSVTEPSITNVYRADTVARPQPKNNIAYNEPVNETTPLKGGPLNAAVNLLVPGLGHYLVSGNYKGENKKPASFIITAFYAGSVAGAFYFKSMSDGNYKKYSDLADYREYLKDANGAIIGVRGADQTKAEGYFSKAKTQHRNSLIALGVGGGILVSDFIYTLLKGEKNKAEWKSETTSFRPRWFISREGNQTTAGVKVKF